TCLASSSDMLARTLLFRSTETRTCDVVLPGKVESKCHENGFKNVSSESRLLLRSYLSYVEMCRSQCNKESLLKRPQLSLIAELVQSVERAPTMIILPKPASTCRLHRECSGRLAGLRRNLGLV